MRAILGLGLLAATLLPWPLPVNAATVAYWRFEAGPEGAPVSHGGAPDGVFYPGVLDSSGNGNDLSVWAEGWAGYAYRADIPASFIPQTGEANNFSVQNTGGLPTLFTTSPTMRAMTPGRFTIEVSFKPEAGFYRTLVGRDSYGAAGINPLLSALYLQIIPGDAVAIKFADVSGVWHEAVSDFGLISGFTWPDAAAGHWYNMAAVSDGTMLSLYLDDVDGHTGFRLVARTDMTGSSPNTALTSGLGSGSDWTAGNWSVGRGFYAGNHTDRAYGLIDEVRISDAALRPDHFLFSPAQTFTTLYSFTASSTNASGIYTNSDGANPYAGLTPADNSNIRYGTTSLGGSSGAGTVFAVNADGTGFTILHSFTGGSDGANPWAGLVLSGNTLYGTTYLGGSSGVGTVFAINTDGTGFTNLHDFTFNQDGAHPNGGLILSGNTLYGTAAYGGSGGYGTVFAINTDGTGYTNLHTFTPTSLQRLYGYDNFGREYYVEFHMNADGAIPVAGLILAGNTLYGTATGGGYGGNGTVFAVNIDGTGFTVLHSFEQTENLTQHFVGGGGGCVGGCPPGAQCVNGLGGSYCACAGFCGGP